MNFDYHVKQIDYGPDPYVANIEQLAIRNSDFRKTIWTGCHLQMTLMSIPPRNEIGFEIHEDTDQILRVEQGEALVVQGKCKNRMDFQQKLCQGEAVFVPAGMWHNVINIGRNALKLSSVYAPPHHPRGTVQHCKEDE